MNVIDVIASLSSDEMKLEYLKYIIDIYQRIKIIKSLKEYNLDSEQLELIERIRETPQVKALFQELKKDKNSFYANSLGGKRIDFSICVFSSDKYDDNLRKKLLENRAYINLINDILDSCFLDESKLQILQEIEIEWWQTEIIKMLKSDYKKLDFLKNIHKLYNVLEIIDSMSDVKIKKEAFERFASDDVEKNKLSDYYFNICKNIKRDIFLYDIEEKLGNIENDLEKWRIIESINDGWLKMKCVEKHINEEITKIKILETLTDEFEKEMLLCSLESDELKIKLKSKINHPHIRARVILTLKSDEEKIKILNEDSTIPRDLKLKTIISLNSDDEKIKFLNSFSIEEKVKILASLKSEGAILRYMKNFYQKGELKPLLKNYKVEKIVDIIKRMNTDENKLFLINFCDCGYETLESDDLKIQFISKHSNIDAKSPEKEQLKEQTNNYIDVQKVIDSFEISERDFQMEKKSTIAWLKGK